MWRGEAGSLEDPRASEGGGRGFYLLRRGRPPSSSGRHWRACMSIRPSRRNCTPSRFRSRRCAPGSPIRKCGLQDPPCWTTRWQGTRDPWGLPCIAHPTVRAARGAPSIRAICPYVATFPRGIRATSAYTRAKKPSRLRPFAAFPACRLPRPCSLAAGIARPPPVLPGLGPRLNPAPQVLGQLSRPRIRSQGGAGSNRPGHLWPA
jgi:hypothetical protein